MKTLQASVSTTRFSARKTFALSAILIAAASGSALAQPAHGTLTASASSTASVSGSKRDATETLPLPVDRDGTSVVGRNPAAKPAVAPAASQQPAEDATYVEMLKSTYGWFEFPVVLTGSSEAQDATRTFEYFAVPAIVNHAETGDEAAHRVLGAYDVAGIAL